jgi:hypothetical protein
MLLRCVLDTWDTEYYLLPFVFALLAWEVRGPIARPPLLALASTALAWLSFKWLPERGVPPDLQAALFLAWSLPLTIFLARRLFAPHASSSALEQPLHDAVPDFPQEMTVSALSRPLSVS